MGRGMTIPDLWAWQSLIHWDNFEEKFQDLMFDPPTPPKKMAVTKCDASRAGQQKSALCTFYRYHKISAVFSTEIRC